MRIAEEYLQCVVYLYPDEESAHAGKWTGGSGFLVHSEWTDGENSKAADFVVTNRHVVEKMRDPVVRMNRTDGTVEAIKTNRNRWQSHPAGDDVSALRFEGFSEEHKGLPVNERAFINQEILSDENIGIGDQVAMIGRLVGHDGTVRNSPTARFGAISMMPGDTLPNDFGHDQEMFLVDCQSLPGFSGSPVFLFQPTTAKSPTALLNAPSWLLGINYMHVHDKEPVRKADGSKAEGLYVQANSGVAGVIPAWRIKQLLDVLKT